MNRYTLEGITRDATAGKTILLVHAAQVGVRDSLQQLEDHVPVAVTATVRRTNGAERITFVGGGAVTLLVADLHNLPRHHADVVVFLHDPEPRHLIHASACSGTEVVCP